MSTLVLKDAGSIQNSGHRSRRRAAGDATEARSQLRRRGPVRAGGTALRFYVSRQYAHLLTACLRMVSSHMEPMMIMKNRISTAEDSPYWL